MESWRYVWRTAVAVQLSSNALHALRRGLLRDDPRLCQGATTTPPPLQCVLDWPLEGGDAIVYAAWQAGEVETVGEGHEFFAAVCHRADELLGEPTAARYWLNHWDDSPRDVVRSELLAEIRLVLEERQTVAGECPAAVA